MELDGWVEKSGDRSRNVIYFNSNAICLLAKVSGHRANKMTNTDGRIENAK